MDTRTLCDIHVQYNNLTFSKPLEMSSWWTSYRETEQQNTNDIYPAK